MVGQAILLRVHIQRLRGDNLRKLRARLVSVEGIRQRAGVGISWISPQSAERYAGSKLGKRGPKGGAGALPRATAPRNNRREGIRLVLLVELANLILVDSADAFIDCEGRRLFACAKPQCL